MGKSCQPSVVELEKLQQWVAAHGTPQQVALRCRIVLAAAAGESDVAIAGQLAVNRNTVILWRKRFGEEGRLFTPLAYTKNFSMIVAAILAITLDPALRLLFTHARNFEFRPRWRARVANAVLVGTIHSEEHHPISRVLIRLYEPVCA